MFNNAGTCTMGMLEDLSLEDWHRIVNLNLFGVVHGVQAAYPVMIRQRSGHIVNVSSLAGLMPVPGSASYVATKFAVVGLSHALRLEAARHNVKVSVVCPASVETPIYDTSNFIGIDREKFKELVPGKPTSPESFARATLRALERNQSTVVPGLAGVLSAVHRHASWMTNILGRNLTSRLAAIRAE
jgi:short-subunit dehydrogenase